ncbi:unnamed protein product [Ixodes pacificus]
MLSSDVCTLKRVLCCLGCGLTVLLIFQVWMWPCTLYCSRSLSNVAVHGSSGIQKYGRRDDSNTCVR